MTIPQVQIELANRVSSWRPIAVGLGMAALAFVLVGFPRYGTDFSVFWSAARNAFGPVYDPNFMTQAQSWLHVPGIRPYAYPPTFLMLTLPWALLPYRFAFAAWVGASSSAFFEAGALLEPRFKFLLIASLISARAWQPGQATLWVGAAIFLALALQSRPYLAGALFGLAMCIKPQIVLLAPLALVMWREWRSLVALVVTGAVLVTLSAIIFGPDKWIAWLISLRRFSDVAKTTYGVVSLAPGWRMTGLAFVLVRAASMAAGVALLWVTRGHGPLARLLGVVGGSLLWAPYALNYEAALFVPIAVGMVLSRSWRIIPGAVALLGGLVSPWLLVAFLACAAPLGRRRASDATAS